MKHRLYSSILILVVLFGLFSGPQGTGVAQAADLICYVDDTAAGPAFDGTTWASAYTDLQLAINDLKCTEIHVAAGSYRPDDGSDALATFQLRSGLTIQGGYPDGGGDTPDPISNVTILDGNNNHYHVVTGSGADSTALLGGFTIQGGRATNLSPHNSGAGVYINNGSPHLQNLVISGNAAGSQGAGLYTYGGNPILDTVTFSGNVAGPGSGGGNGGGMCIGSGSPSLMNVTFINNSAQDLGGTGGSGGGLLVRTANPSLDHVAFTTNTANGSGGGLSINNSSVVLNNVNFNGNQAGLGSRGGNGGGMYHGGSTSSTFTGVTFSNNEAYAGGGTGGNGGGLYLAGTSASLTTVTFDGNSAIASAGVGGNGGGLYLEGIDAGLTGVTFQNNIADAGGGIYSASGSPELNEVTFQSNTANASNGGGIYIGSGTLSISDSLFNDCESNSGSGGGIYLNSGGNLVMENTRVENSFAGDNGGGIYAAAGSNTTITGGSLSLNISGFGGAGLYLNAGALTLNGVIFDHNTAGSLPNYRQGGGIYIMDASPSLTDVTFRYNQGYEGGGLYSLRSTPRLERVTFENNNGTYGGGMIAYNGSSELLDVRFTNNHARYGGGLFAFDSPTTIRDCEVTGNTATLDLSGEGGGLYIEAPLTMTDCRLDGNSAVVSGGGLYLNDSGPNNLFNLSVTNNSVSEEIGSQEYYNVGGGIFCGHNCNITNLLLAGNHAKRGGGIASFDNIVNIVNATIVGNYASEMGSAIYNLGGHRTTYNSIVWGNTEGITGPDVANESIVSSSYENSLLEDGSCPSMSTCSNLFYDDPQFIDPASGNYRLPPLSPAVDAGNTSALPADSFDLDNDGILEESIPFDLNGQHRVVLGRVDLGAYEAQVWNNNWTQALELPLTYDGPNQVSGSIDRYLDLPGQSRWYKFAIQPSSKVIVTLTGLPANYDLALYKDISEVSASLDTSQDLLKLSAEFAPDTFSPDTFSPDTFSPDTFSPDTFSPDTFSPDTFSPDTFSPDTFSPDTFSPDTFSPDTFSPDTFSPDTFSPDTFSPDTFSSAQTRSLIAVSAHDGIQGEGIMVNTWTKSEDFYIRVRGRNGAYNYDHPFHLSVTMLSGSCGDVNPILPEYSTSLIDSGSRTLILTDMNKVEGTQSEKDLLQSNLETLAAGSNGQVVEVGEDDRVHAASDQAQSNPACVYAMNLQAEAIKGIVDNFRELNPDLEYLVLVGNDHAFPFFRYSDSALLASEIDYSPPVLDDSTSQASLKSGYILSQDTYGSKGEISYKSGSFPIQDLAVGRLVETASDINHYLNAYLSLPENPGLIGGSISPSNALVTGYDFLADDADAVKDELRKSMDPAGVVESNVDTLIMGGGLPLDDPSAWTAQDLRDALSARRHDIVFLAGHFSAASTLAADYKTHMLASELLDPAFELSNILVYSAGCHSGYNIVNADGVPNVTEEPDWAQAFAAKGATFIGGTGYQYGDTDFIEYSERLYLEFTKQLRYGSGPVAVGKALVQAKQAYLAATPVMRGIHEKSLLEATLFGLPMLQVNLTLGRGDTRDEGKSDVVLTPVPGKLGLPSEDGGLGLQYYDLHVATPTTLRSWKLNQSNLDGSTSKVDAYYLEGKSGIVVNPAEPVLPLDLINVTSPNAGYVLRGVAWRGGTFTDRTDILPLTGAATEDLRAPHVPFYSDVFYPIRPWNVNYYDALGSSDGATRLALIPAQYRSSTPGSTTGILRAFNHMDFRLFYSNNIESFTNPLPENNGWTNTPALAAPPDISHIDSFIPTGTMALTSNVVNFEIQVTGDPSAGIQAVWIVYTLDCGNSSGTWQPLDLQQDSLDSRLWKGSLDLGSASTDDLCFVVQAVNGVGLGTLMTNQGAGYLFGQDPGALPQGQSPLTLEFDSPATDAPYGSQQSFTVIAKNKDGNTVDGLKITFNLGGMGRLAATDNGGKADANFYLAMDPGNYTLEAAFAGNDTYAPAVASTPFKILPGSSELVLDPKTKTASPNSMVQFTATLKSGNVPLSGKNVALTYADESGTQITDLAVTDYAGRATWSVKTPATGRLNLSALFGQSVSDMLDLSSQYYVGSSDTATLTAVISWININNIPAGAIYGGKFTAAFTGSYGGSPWVTSSTPATCTVETDKLTVDFKGVGTCTLQAHAPADGSFPAADGSDQGFSIGKATLTVTADDKSAQYSDLNPPLTFHYSGFKWTDTASVIDTPPTCNTTRKLGDPAMAYNNAITCANGLDDHYTFGSISGTFTVTLENAYVEYSGDTIAQVNTNLNLRATVWDSAAIGYPGSKPEPGGTIGDITKIKVYFSIYPANTCGSGSPITTLEVFVVDSGTTGDGIGTASTTYKSTSEASYCVIAKVTAPNVLGMNKYYTAANAQPAGLDFYLNSGKFSTGGGGIKDPNGARGNFGFNARYNKSGKPQGQMVYIYRGMYNGVTADFIFKSNALSALQFVGTTYPISSTLQGKGTIQIYDANTGASLFSDGAATFKAVVIDTNKSSGFGFDSFSLTVWDKNAVVYKLVPTTLLSSGNVVIHLK